MVERNPPKNGNGKRKKLSFLVTVNYIVYPTGHDWAGHRITTTLYEMCEKEIKSTEVEKQKIDRCTRE